jgi:hypothetical protein
MIALLEVELVLEAEKQNNQHNKRSVKKLAKHQFTSKRRSFDHQGSFNNIQQDHLGTDPLFGMEFILFFRLSQPCVELIIQAITKSNNNFYTSFGGNRYGLVGPLLEAKVLLPLKVLAFGVAPHTDKILSQWTLVTNDRPQ